MCAQRGCAGAGACVRKWMLTELEENSFGVDSRELTELSITSRSRPSPACQLPYVCMDGCMYVCMNVCKHVCMHADMCVYIVTSISVSAIPFPLHLSLHLHRCLHLWVSLVFLWQERCDKENDCQARPRPNNHVSFQITLKKVN